jgi:hypothetical protein
MFGAAKDEEISFFNTFSVRSIRGIFMGSKQTSLKAKLGEKYW